MKKVLVLFTIISVAFTSCEKDETLTTPPVVEIDIRDAAEGIFQSEWDDGESIQFKFLKNDSIQNQMILREVEDGVEGDEAANILNIVETEIGFKYDVDEDDFTGIYNKTTDTHTLRIIETGFTLSFNRVN
ncbi:hypothetical protein OAP87_02365 [Flavobacteriaceae bacterium]|nr:hypothetical protein [Flavobacteriaceae bacterium]